MAERTMEELLRAPTEGYGEAIVLPEINADHFEIKTNLLQLVQANPFNGRENKNPHAHINSFKRITSTLRFRNVPNDSEQDSLNAAAGGNLLSKTTREALNIIENKSKVRYSRNRSNASRMNATSSKTDERINKLADQLLTLVEIVSKKVVTFAPVKAVEETCVTCSGSHLAILSAPITTRLGLCNNGNLQFKLTLNRVSISMAHQSCDKASNQMEKIFQIIQDLRFDISFADALLLMPRFAPTIKSLLMNKEKLLELAKIPLNENCLAMLLKKLPEKLGDPGKFLIPCDFSGMNVCQTWPDLGIRRGNNRGINLPPIILSIWKKLSLSELTPTRMTLELADRSITRPKGLAEDIFVKVGNFHFPTDFVVVDFKADPRVPLILGRSFLRTSRALIDVYEGELVLRDENEQITFHVNGTSKHPQKHVNESIKMVNDTCKDSFKRFTDKPTLVCLLPSEDVNNEKEKQEVKNLAEPTVKRQTRITPCLKNFKVICKESMFHSNKIPQVSLVFAITSTLPSIEPKDSLIMGDEHLSTFSTEEIVPIPRESKDTSGSESENVLPSDINPLFDEVLKDIEYKDSYPNLDELTFLVTPLTDSNKDEYLTPEDDIEILLHHDPSIPLKSVASILKGFIEDPPFEENDDLFDLECKTNDWKGILYDAPIDKAECFNSGGDNDEIDAFLAIEIPTYIEGYYDSKGDVTYLESFLSDDTTHNLYPKMFFDHEPQQLRNELENEPLITFSPKSDPLHHEFIGELITIPPRIDREHEDYINRMSLLCNNSSSQSPKIFHTIIESLPTSTTLVEDSNPNREEIDIFSRPDDSIPPSIESDFDLEEDIIDNLLNDDPTHERLTFNIEPDAPVINNVDELNKVECFDPGGGEINVEVDDFFTLVIWTFLPYLTYPEVSPLLSSTKNEDTIFDPGIFT
ncbi:reverse transcriptase domain-containing protein [Tanacetum coccineum]